MLLFLLVQLVKLMHADLHTKKVSTVITCTGIYSNY